MTELAAIAESIWDAVVVGAGPAGAASAALLADRGWRVLLVEKSRWPRGKACGGCVNADAIATLRRMNLHGALRGAAETKQIEICSAAPPLTVRNGGVAIARVKFDERLAEAAIDRGVRFLPSTQTTLHPAEARSGHRRLTLRRGDETASLFARIVLACDGINGTLLKDEQWAAWRVASDAWLGASATLPARALTIDANAVRMTIGAHGYIGLVRQPDGRIHLGAALDSAHCREAGGPARLIARILREQGLALPADASLQGTGLLTRRRCRIGGWRVLCVGDACGYVEPFTGEGIAWALASAEAVVSLLPADLSMWPSDLPRRWKRLHRRTVGRRQWICHAVRYVVRRPRLWRAAVRVAKVLPVAVNWIAPRPELTLAGDCHD